MTRKVSKNKNQWTSQCPGPPAPAPPPPPKSDFGKGPKGGLKKTFFGLIF